MYEEVAVPVDKRVGVKEVMVYTGATGFVSCQPSQVLEKGNLTSQEQNSATRNRIRKAQGYDKAQVVWQQADDQHLQCFGGLVQGHTTKGEQLADISQVPNGRDVILLFQQCVSLATHAAFGE